MNCPGRNEILEAVNGTREPAGYREHLAACASCRAAHDGLAAAAEVLSTPVAAPPSGPCLSDSQLIVYARRSAPVDRERALEEHLTSCAECRDAAADLSDALDAEPQGEVPAGLEQRILALVPRTRRTAPVTRLRPKPAPVLGWAVGAAAAIFLAVLLFLSIPGGDPKDPVTKKRELPKGEKIVKDEPKKEDPRAPETPRKEEPPKVVIKPETPLLPEVPRKETPAPLVKEPPKPPVTEEPKKEAPKPVVENTPRKEEPKTEVKAPKYLPVKILAANGSMARRAGGAIAKNAVLTTSDEVFTDHRHLASFTLEGGVAVTVEKSTSFRVERVEGGETRLTLLSGTAFFKVDKRKEPFIVATPSADSVVVGTAFQVEMDEKRTALFVLEGSIRFRNDKGEVTVNAGQRSNARRAEKPSAAQRADVAGETAWTRRPDLAGDPKSEPWMEHATGANKKLAGVVITAPYADWETAGGIFAQAVAESLDAGMVLGHGHRDRPGRIWMSIDRWNEQEFKPDGTILPVAQTERAKKTTAEYLGHLRAAAGVAPAQPVPLVAVMRVHSELQAGQPLEVCEVAWTGFSKPLIVQLKATYEQLLDKYKPATRLDMRFEGVDETYTVNGAKRKFMFTESDAVSEGYLSPRHSQNAVAFFFPVSFSRRPLDANDPYAKILAELIEWLAAHKR